MSQAQSNWWDLHVRQARGEQLSPEEQAQYGAEMERHDKEVVSSHSLTRLKELRLRVEGLANENAQMRARITAIEEEIRRVEHSLSKHARELLGVGE